MSIYSINFIFNNNKLNIKFSKINGGEDFITWVKEESIL